MEKQIKAKVIRPEPAAQRSPITALCFDNIPISPDGPALWHAPAPRRHSGLLLLLTAHKLNLHTRQFCRDVPDARSWINIKAPGLQPLCLCASSDGQAEKKALLTAAHPQRFRTRNVLLYHDLSARHLIFQSEIYNHKHSRAFFIFTGYFIVYPNNDPIHHLRGCHVISVGRYHIGTWEPVAGYITGLCLECVRTLPACERCPTQTTDMDFCLQEMGPCLLLLTQACTECTNTIILYYITLI